MIQDDCFFSEIPPCPHSLHGLLRKTNLNPNKRKITNLSPGTEFGNFLSVSDSFLFPSGCDPIPHRYFCASRFFLNSGTAVQQLDVFSISRAREQRKRRSGRCCARVRSWGSSMPLSFPPQPSQTSPILASARHGTPAHHNTHATCATPKTQSSRLALAQASFFFHFYIIF